MLAPLAIAMLVGCCLGGGATATKPTVLVIRHTTAAWIPAHHTWREGPRHTDVYYLACTQADGYPKSVVAMCGQIARHNDRYLGPAKVELVPSMPITDVVTIRGVVDGSAVKLSYNSGAKPQFPWWMRLLAVLRRA